MAVQAEAKQDVKNTETMPDPCPANPGELPSRQSIADLLKDGGVQGIDTVLSRWLSSPKMLVELLMISACSAWMGAVLTYIAYWLEALRLKVPGAAEWPPC
jgi:hypothetical protein